jgi:hypothetical protein
MALERLTGTKQRVALTQEDDATQTIEFDCTVSETHIGNANVTSHPVEDGSDMTDHIQRTPEELQLVVIMTDTPLLFLSSRFAQPAVPGGDPTNRAQDAYGFLKAIKDAGKTVSVITTLRDYVNMAIVGMSVGRDKDTSRIVDIALSLKEVLIATTEQVEAPKRKKTKPKKKKKKGKKQKKSEPVPDKPRTLLNSIGDAVGGFFSGG